MVMVMVMMMLMVMVMVMVMMMTNAKVTSGHADDPHSDSQTLAGRDCTAKPFTDCTGKPPLLRRRQAFRGRMPGRCEVFLTSPATVASAAGSSTSLSSSSSFSSLAGEKGDAFGLRCAGTALGVETSLTKSPGKNQLKHHKA